MKKHGPASERDRSPINGIREIDLEGGTGGFTISIDLEVGWGRLDDPQANSYRTLFSKVPEVVDELLHLFDEYDFSATWAVVGRLLDQRTNQDKELSGLSKYYEGKELYTDYLDGSGVVERIDGADPSQEWASHSYEHLNFADRGCSESLAKEDFEASRSAFVKGLGVVPTSFVYPRNRFGYCDLLPKYGFRVVRGPTESRLDIGSPRSARALRQLDYYLGITPRTGGLKVGSGPLLITPGHMLFRRHFRGIRRWIPQTILVKRALRGLRRAAKTHQHFHLWFHPHDFGSDVRGHIAGLRLVLDEACRLKNRNMLRFYTMHELGIQILDRQEVALQGSGST